VVGRRDLWPRRRTIAVAIALPTAYLCGADAVAIGAGIWIIHADRTLGLRLGDLPLEEAIFFLVTNTMVVQAIALISARGWLAR
jgi:lycopene cyclase domain-containing protein